MKILNICFVLLFFNSVVAEEECDEEWYQFENKCFKYHNDMAGANFHDAMSICEYSYRATLVTIHSQEEFDFIYELVFEKQHAEYSVWIGLIRVSNQSFVWFDRSQSNYTNWGPNEPNNRNSKNYCVVMSSASATRGKWFDVGCTTTYLVICQKYLTINEIKLDLDYNISIADQINMELDIKESVPQLSSNEDLNSVKTLTSVNIILTLLLFIVLIGYIILNRRKRITKSDFAFDNSLDRNMITQV